MAKVLVCTRRLSTARTVKKLCAKIEKIANIIKKTARGKSLLDDDPGRFQFKREAVFSAGESRSLLPIMLLLYTKNVF
jgi:hypothetical protein